MSYYLGRNKFFVKDEENKFVYMVNGYTVYDNCDYIELHLELVSGWDYISLDGNDVQGWCSADRFVEDIQDIYINQYFLRESMEECLRENYYTILENIHPSLQSIIDKYLEY